MTLTLLLVGKTTDKNLAALIEDYHGRLKHYLNFRMVVLPELKNAKNLTEAQQKQAEGKMILSSIDAGSLVVLLDERGREYRSIELSRQMEKWIGAGRNITMVVGGPYGFSEEVYARANEMLSLSKMTFSHQMVRLFLIEQLYRAMTIIKQEKYHHE